MLDPAEQAFQLDFPTRRMKDETCEEHGGDLELDDLEFMDEDERRVSDGTLWEAQTAR